MINSFTDFHSNGQNLYRNFTQSNGYSCEPYQPLRDVATDFFFISISLSISIHFRFNRLFPFIVIGHFLVICRCFLSLLVSCQPFSCASSHLAAIFLGAVLSLWLTPSFTPAPTLFITYSMCHDERISTYIFCLNINNLLMIRVKSSKPHRIKAQRLAGAFTGFISMIKRERERKSERRIHVAWSCKSIFSPIIRKLNGPHGTYLMQHIQY